MKAKIKATHRYSTAILFSGRVFTKADWTDIPEGMEEQAAQIDYLEFPVFVIKPLPVVKPEPLPKPIHAIPVDDMVITETPAPQYEPIAPETDLAFVLPKPPAAKKPKKAGK